MRKTVFQLFRYGLVGVALNLILYGIYWMVTYWGVDPKLVITVLYPVGVLAGFASHRKWTFSSTEAVRGSLPKFIVAHFFGYSINFCMLLVLTDWLGYPHQWIQALAIFVVAGFLFVAFRYFVFPDAGRKVRGGE